MRQGLLEVKREKGFYQESSDMNEKMYFKWKIQHKQRWVVCTF